MESLLAFYEEIDLPREAAEALENTDLSSSALQAEAVIEKLCSPAAYSEGADDLKKLFPDDENGWKKLKCMLLAALRARKFYEMKKIPDRVFIDTMKCFSRFVREHNDCYGSYGFDREFWTGRQTSLLLFRLGELEYELSAYEEKKAISIHIPSGSDMSEEKITDSLQRAKDFFGRYFPEYADAIYMCRSWLLYPALQRLLPENSKILRFQNRFKIVETDETVEAYKQWVYKNARLSPEQFPENTSLQRNMKRYILQGGKIGEGTGILAF